MSQPKAPDYLSYQKSNLLLSALQKSFQAIFDDNAQKDEVFHALLKEIGSSLNVSRAYIFNAYKDQSNRYLVNQTHEWSAEGIESQIDNPMTHHVNLEDIGMGRWQRAFENHQIINDQVAKLQGAEKEILAKQNIQVIIVAPIFVENQWHGFIGFDECHHNRIWSDIEINALKLCAQTIGSTLSYLALQESKYQAEAQASDVQNKIYNALEAAEHGVWEWDLTTDKVYYSEILQKQLGYNSGEFSDSLDEWQGRVHPDDLPRVYQIVQDHLAGKIPVYRAEFRMRKKDGSYAWMLAIAKAKRDINGKPISLPGTHTDLTPLKELEEELNKQQKILSALVDGFPDLVWLKDREGVYLAANYRFEDFFGHSVKNIIGKTDYDFVDKELADFFREHDQKAMNKNSPSINEETITFASDGHQETLETIKTPISFDNGELIGVLGVGRDITERKNAQSQLSLAASVFSNAHDGIIICNAQADIIDVNPMFEEISGYSKTEVIGQNPSLLSSGIQSPTFYQKFWAKLHSQGFWKGEMWNRRKNGEIYAILANISVIKDDQGEISHYLSIFSDISYLKAHQQELENLAHFDTLTGLPNRVLLADRLQQEVIRTKRHNNNLAVCFIDLDNFKPINDSYGHSMGDQLLKQLANRLTENLREEDTLARIGGDEFVLLLAGQTSKQQTVDLVEKLLKLIAQPVEINNKELTLSASMGISLYPEDQTDSDGLIRHADQAMYEAKLQGKNRYHFFDVTAAQAYQELNKTIDEVQHALRNDEFVLYLQPKTDLKKHQIIGFEALIRWQHPDKGLIFPDSFLPAITNHALSYRLDIWVLTQAFKQLNYWQKQHHDFVLSINITPSSLLSIDFVNELANQLAANKNIPADQLEIEVLETSNFREIEIAKNNLAAIKSLGVRIALDDFGTGSSSLSYLKSLPANVVKIDQNFIFDILDDRNDLAIVEGIIQLSRAFDLEVIAEGVETKEHAEMLYALGCHTIQGYWISKPIAPSEVECFINNFSIPSNFKYL